MKVSTLALLGMAFFTLSFCQPSPPPKTPAELKKEMVERLESATIALMSPHISEGEIELVPYCGGVWVGKDKIITARHCIEDEPILMYRTFGSDELHGVKVVDTEEDFDLALLVDPKPPEHPVVELAEDSWAGEPVHIMGHTTGLSWSYIEGVVSSSRLIRGKGTPPAMQISSPAWMGNSGGGAFDDDGKLVGISSWVSTRAPMLSFFIKASTIKEFLARPRKK